MQNEGSERGALTEKVRKIEDAIDVCYERVYQLEARINNRSNTVHHKAKLMQELSEVDKLLATNKIILKNMRKHNQHTFFAAIGIGLIIFIIWMITELI